MHVVPSTVIWGLAMIIAALPASAMAQGSSYDERLAGPLELLRLSLACPIETWTRAVTGAHTEIVSKNSYTGDTELFQVVTEEGEFDLSTVTVASSAPQTNIEIRVTAAYSGIASVKLRDVSTPGARDTPKVELYLECSAGKKCFQRQVTSSSESLWRDRSNGDHRVRGVALRLCDESSANNALDALTEMLRVMKETK